MFSYLRDLRHHNSLKNYSHGIKLEISIGSIIEILPFNFNVNQFVTNNFKFKLHARFAFSNLKTGETNIIIFFQYI